MPKSIRLKNNDYWCMDYATYIINTTATISGVNAWTSIQIPFNSNGQFQTNNTNNFEKNGNYIKSKFKGKVLIMRQFSVDFKGEVDIIDEYGWINALETHQNYAMTIKDVNVNDNIDFIFSGGMNGNLQIYGARLIVIRIA